MRDVYDQLLKLYESEETTVKKNKSSKKLLEGVIEDLDTALYTPGVWGVEFVGDDCICFETEREARKYFNSLTKDDIYPDGESIELFRVINEDGDTETIDSISIYESVNKAKKSSKKLSEGVIDDLDTALHTPGVWGVEFVGDDCICFETEKEARRYFNSLTKDDIYRDGEGIELFRVINEDGDTETIDSISIYED